MNLVYIAGGVLVILVPLLIGLISKLQHMERILNLVSEEVDLLMIYREREAMEYDKRR